ncbi:helix-turn-helix transcriptional regulator [Caulobacter sp. 602-2]|uniref:Helix-turn-helix transcriptional regulator n=1 Tax=Caulobacter sp. 602-2 TaxID=2710887 RepID=A0A6G4QV58_9CAUL|nr:helix-turn-helix transcriptional regulator [Caulobacter sp. 602-2]
MASTIFDPGHAELVAMLKATRLERGMTQAAVGERVGKSQSFISLIERGQRRVDVIEFIALGRAMGVDVEQLFSRVASEHSREAG